MSTVDLPYSRQNACAALGSGGAQQRNRFLGIRRTLARCYVETRPDLPPPPGLSEIQQDHIVATPRRALEAS